MEHLPTSDAAQSQPEKPVREANRILFKSLLIGALTLIMLIPAAFIQSLVYERSERQSEVVHEVSDKWAGDQTIAGPVLAVPYWKTTARAENTTERTKIWAFIMPETLSATGAVFPEQRHRSIYDVTLYRSKLRVAGTFAVQNFANAGIQMQDVVLSEARLLLGVDDVRGFEESVAVQFGDTEIVLDAGVPDNALIPAGLSKPVVWDNTKPLAFSFNLALKGASALSFVPTGKTNEVQLNSTWQYPSFAGKFLPSEQANVSQKGFNAKWHVLQISTGIPGIITDQANPFDNKAFGVQLIQPTDGYAKTSRSVKYALLFIALTFTVFFFIEMLQKRQIHPLQYLLVGLALCVFYTLLLSFTEYVGFDLAYGISAAATVTLIGSYVWSIFKRGKIAAAFTAALAALYTYIFVLIQLEDFALLAGSIGLFALLATVMYYSRKIDWYGAKQSV